MEQKKRKIPERQCLGCNAHKPKGELLRVVRTPEGDVRLDFGGKMNGRGAYICRDVECLKKARKNKGLERSFKMSIPTEVYDALEKEFEDIEAE